jgi:hypothetical protein
MSRIFFTGEAGDGVVISDEASKHENGVNAKDRNPAY